MREADDVKAWVLVAGGGTVWVDDHSVVRHTAEEVGRALAEQGCGLVSGGWLGVDLCTLRAFATRCRELGLEPSERILQFIRTDFREEESLGNIVRVEAGTEEWLSTQSYADAVVLLAGREGTHGVFLTSLQQGLPRYPVAATGGAAKDAYDQMVKLWPILGNPGMSKQAFVDLNVPVTTREDAERAARLLVTSVLDGASAKRRAGPRRLPLRIWLSYHSGEAKWGTKLRNLLLPAEREGLIRCFSEADIRPGEEEATEVAEHVRECDVAVAFLSADYLGAGDLLQRQLVPLCARVAARQATLLWFVLSPCDWGSVAEIASRKPVLPANRAVEGMSAAKAQEALMMIVRAVHQIAVEARSSLAGQGL